jgi:hypothetical protein
MTRDEFWEHVAASRHRDPEDHAERLAKRLSKLRCGIGVCTKPTAGTFGVPRTSSTAAAPTTASSISAAG